MLVYKGIEKHRPLKKLFWESQLWANFILSHFIDGYSGGHKNYFRKIGWSVNIYYFCYTFVV